MIGLPIKLIEAYLDCIHRKAQETSSSLQTYPSYTNRHSLSTSKIWEGIQIRSQTWPLPSRESPSTEHLLRIRRLQRLHQRKRNRRWLLWSQNQSHHPALSAGIYHSPTRCRSGQTKSGCSLLTGNTVNLYLGPKRKHYLLHRDLLSSCSDFFKQTFEKEPNVPLYLTEYDPIAFELFVDWLYRGSLKKISVDLATSAGVSNRSYLLDLYYVAEAWGLFELKNLVTDRMRTWKWGSDCFGPAMLHKLYNSTTDKSPLRRFMVDHFLFASAVWNGEKRIRSVEEHLKYGNNRFVMDCFEATYAAYAKTKYRDPEKRPACAYHIHKDGRSCDG